MTNKLYRTILGLILLISLYLDNDNIIYATIIIVIFEGVTNFRIPIIVNQIRKLPEPDYYLKNTRFNFQAERAYRLLIATLILITYPLGVESVLWFLPWFISFVILGAGVSGVCPVMRLMTWIGFR